MADTTTNYTPSLVALPTFGTSFKAIFLTPPYSVWATFSASSIHDFLPGAPAHTVALGPPYPCFYTCSKTALIPCPSMSAWHFPLCYVSFAFTYSPTLPTNSLHLFTTYWTIFSYPPHQLTLRPCCPAPLLSPAMKILPQHSLRMSGSYDGMVFTCYEVQVSV